MQRVFDRAGPENASRLIFLHIPKTAGNTLKAIIVRQYPRDAIYTISSQEALTDFKQLPAERRQSIAVLAGHVPFGLHDLLGGPVIYITLLRHPVERIVSLYYYLIRHPTTDLYPEIVSRNMSLQEFVASGLTVQVLNDQTRLLSGMSESQHGAALDIAKRNLQQHIAVAGVAERFDEALLLMKKHLGWRHVWYRWRNVGKHRPALRDLPRGTISLIEKHNGRDLELFEFAAKRFDTIVAAQGPSFRRQVHVFQWCNRLYGRHVAMLSDACRSPRVLHRAERLLPRMVKAHVEALRTFP